MENCRIIPKGTIYQAYMYQKFINYYSIGWWVDEALPHDKNWGAN